ncbi:MAG: penicillin acylase family protein [Bryobacterales bacterium]|nr:penicillin acylase family protein [Bryobacterales bacterium]
MLARFLAVLVVVTPASNGETVRLPGLQQPVEILRDRWGVPHIYARTQADLFFAQGYMAARDRLWQIDLWRRIGTGKLSEILGPAALERDRLARSVRFRGDWNAEWRSYAPDAKPIIESFVAGINAYIDSLGGRRPLEFRVAGYDPGRWVPEDVVARMAGLVMTRNLSSEVRRAEDARRFGLETLERYMPPEPFVRLEIPHGLDLADITGEILRVYEEATGPARFPETEASNNWVVAGSLSASGKPLLANDPHRPILIPSLRKTVHLVGPGWNAIGAGEPALPGIALGHNEHIAFGFTIVGIDQQDLYVERLHPEDPNRYLYRGKWLPVEIERQAVIVQGRQAPETVELRYTRHGPVIHEDRSRRRAYALRWVGSEPGGAGYLAALSVARARNWSEFLRALERWKVPSQNMVYADTAGNIGWQVAGLTPIRPNWSGLFPVPGHTGEFEWAGFRKLEELPRLFNPPSGFIATANHNILPPNYRVALGYEWAPPYRFQRIQEVLSTGRKCTLADFERLQHDVVSLPARRFQGVLRRLERNFPGRKGRIVDRLLRWDGALTSDSFEAVVYEVWLSKLPEAVFGAELGSRVSVARLLEELEKDPKPHVLESALEAALQDIESRLGPDEAAWRWGRLHTVEFRHPLGVKAWHRGPFERPGDAHTVNAASGPAFRQTNGASYRQIFDLADWDRSVITNVPGESGDPSSKHYDDLIADWLEGRYHPLPFSRAAVEAATVERITLEPVSGGR